MTRVCSPAFPEQAQGARAAHRPEMPLISGCYCTNDVSFSFSPGKIGKNFFQQGRNPADSPCEERIQKPVTSLAAGAFRAAQGPEAGRRKSGNALCWTACTQTVSGDGDRGWSRGGRQSGCPVPVAHGCLMRADTVQSGEGLSAARRRRAAPDQPPDMDGPAPDVRHVSGGRRQRRGRADPCRQRHAGP